MIFAALKLAHVLAVMVWIGGMVFAHFFMRPAALKLEPPQRIRLMHGALQRFFAAVLVAIVVILGSGVWMIGHAAKTSVQAGLGFNMPLDWTIMATLGLDHDGHLWPHPVRPVQAPEQGGGGAAIGRPAARPWLRSAPGWASTWRSGW